MQMLDFTSALYLGMRHPSCSLRGWQELTLGKPAALEDPPGIFAVEQALANLTGCDAVLLESSTLHAWFDLLAAIAGPGTRIFLDGNSYPIARWAAQWSSSLGSLVETFDGHDANALNRMLCKWPRWKPVIVTDGLSPANGNLAPLRTYESLAAMHGGLVVVDDTQALGILGAFPNRSTPYGIGGGGSLRNLGVRSEAVVVVNSLAKGFGVPVAMLGGSAALIGKIKKNSLMRVHCSPPSAAAIGAAAQALEDNRHSGKDLRSRLAQNVARFRDGLKQLGLAATRSLFPVQSLRFPNEIEPTLVHSRLLERGFRTILHGDARSGPQLSFLLTARHAFAEIDQAIQHLADVIKIESHKTMTGVTVYDSES